MSTYQDQDPLDAAENPEVQLPEYFGQAQIDGWYCVLQKGSGKVPFDPQQHRLDDRRTAIKLGILPLPEQNVTRDVFRDYIAEFGAWPRITLPSIKAVGLTVKSLQNAWIRLALVPEGRTYVNRDGETRDSLTLKVLAVYPDEAACRAAYLSQSVTSGTEPSDPPFTPAAPGPTPAAPASNGNGNQRERETALRFVEVLIRENNGDETALAQRIAGMPVLAKYFTVQSPEVRQALDQYHFDQLAKAA